MSTLSGLKSHIDQEGILLRQLNDAALCVQAAALGDLKLLKLTQHDVDQATSTLSDFLNTLLKALKTSLPDPTISALVDNIKHESEKTVEDWESDIQDLIQKISDSKTIQNSNALMILEDVLNLLNADYSDAVKKLYYKYR